MVYILLAPGFEEMEALVPADLLRRAGVEVALVSLDGELVPGGHNIAVKADCTLSEVKLEGMEAVMLPGGGVGVANLGSDPRVEELVKQAAQQGKRLAAICAAPSLLSKWGLLAGKRAVCYPTWKDKIADACYLPEEKLAVDGSTITGQAAGASFEFGLKLIEVLRGADTADRVRKEICL
ncbi:MAG: DJ-1/PfpI family protein [Clostridium sp.]|nr:DJ-1/PfpI family protein [Clostridium sp.]